MMVQAQEEMGKGLANPTDPHHTLTIIQPSTSQPQKSKQHRKPRRKVTEVPQPSDPIEHGVNTPRSGEDSLKLTKLMKLCTKLQQRVLNLESTKTTQALEIDSLKKRVKRLKRIKRPRTYGLKRLYKVGLSAKAKSSKDEGVDVAEQAKEVVDDITLAKALMEIKSAKPKAVKVVIQEPEQGTTTTTPITITAASSRPKAKGLVIHEQEQAPIPTVSLQQPSQVKDKEKRNKPPTRAQQRSIMCTYLKNMDGWKLKSLKKKYFAEIQELFDKVMKKVNTFVDFRTELVEESSKKAKTEITQEGSVKRAGDELEQERSKKQKVEDDKESEELNKCL
uniref:Uncharacterized protein n=1 Tax=Tanacetum cinerariifolium TaxID=118510 RepID=A0A699HC83_TANCI|nr:hypothetical protein [Tanacetum cinerariifolium]